MGSIGAGMTELPFLARIVSAGAFSMPLAEEERNVVEQTTKFKGGYIGDYRDK